MKFRERSTGDFNFSEVRADGMQSVKHMKNRRLDVRQLFSGEYSANSIRARSCFTASVMECRLGRLNPSSADETMSYSVSTWREFLKGKMMALSGVPSVQTPSIITRPMRSARTTQSNPTKNRSHHLPSVRCLNHPLWSTIPLLLAS